MEKLTCKYNMLFSSLGNTMEDDITASSAEVFSSEGRSVTLSCTYSVQADNLQWYRQDPGSAPQFLLLITDTTSPSVVEAKPPHPRLNATLNKEKNQVDLKIISAEVSDSAVYYCALQPTVTGNTKTLYKNLWSKDNTILHKIHQRESHTDKLQVNYKLLRDLQQMIKRKDQ
uniref:Ig-like domain-containing protein n=1 Tax=Sander lucioperca TaxID=283035 RepID=A0A8C9ZBS4_SANLU